MKKTICVAEHCTSTLGPMDWAVGLVELKAATSLSLNMYIIFFRRVLWPSLLWRPFVGARVRALAGWLLRWSLGQLHYVQFLKHVLYESEFFPFISLTLNLGVYGSYAQSQALTDSNSKRDVSKRHLILISSEAVRGLHVCCSGYLIYASNCMKQFHFIHTQEIFWFL